MAEVTKTLSLTKPFKSERYDVDVFNINMDTIDKLYSNTIEELKLKALKIGDVVQVLGYYEKGDGAHHLRRISTADDGTGELLINGLFANIIHNGEVNVKQIGLTPSKTLEENSEKLNKIMNNSTIKEFVFSEILSIGNIVPERSDVIFRGLERNDVHQGGLVVLNCRSDINFLDCSKVSSVSLKNLRIYNFKNFIHSTANNFRPTFYNVDAYLGSENGINFVPADTSVNSYKSFGFGSFIKGLAIRATKKAINIDFTNLSGNNWANLSCIKESNLVGNEVGIYIKALGRAEAFKLESVDLTENNCKENSTFAELKNSLNTKKYGGIILENCRGVNIKITDCYLEYSGSVAKLKGLALDELRNSTVYQNITKVKDGVYFQDDTQALAFNEKYAALNIINSSECGFDIENSWIHLVPAIIKSELGTNNRFITKGYNDINCNLEFFDDFNYQINNVSGIDYISISEETTKKKTNDITDFYKIKNENIKYIKNKFKKSGILYETQEIDLSKINSLSDFVTKISRANGVVVLKNTFTGTLKYGANPITCTDDISFLGGTFIFNKIDGSDRFISAQSNSNISFYKTNFVIRSSEDFKFFVSLQGMKLTLTECNFDFTKFTGSRLMFDAVGVLILRGCSTTGIVPKFFYSSGLIVNTNIQPSLMNYDTPYYTLKMQQEGIYEDYIAYRDELHVYEQSQSKEASVLLLEPIVPQSITEFATKYNLI
ncbi:MAG: hypothetical protein ACRC6A_09135 [Fusobacteriaceae bacterium]